MLPSPRLRLRCLTGGFRVLSGASDPIALRARGRSCRGLGEVPDADQIVDRGGEHEHPVDAVFASVPGLVQQPDSLQPPEDFFDPFALPLADGIAGMPRRARLDRTAAPRGVLRPVWRGPAPAPPCRWLA